jgi:AraC-like DNA-binding protein
MREHGRNDHDRDTGGAGRDTGIAAMTDDTPPAAPELLRSALQQLRLDGAIFFRAEFTEGFSIESTPNAAAPVLQPGAERIILFHILVRGSMWVSVPGGERHYAQQGDVIVLPYGNDHIMEGSSPAECVSILTLLDPPPWDLVPAIRHGGGGERADIVCGYLVSDDPLFEPALRALPPVFVVRLPDVTSAGWVQASIDYALEYSDPAKAGTMIATRLPELVLIEVLRLHLANAPAADHGWIAALRDPVLAPALSLLHTEPERRWTVAELAAGAAVSRSLLDDRFRQILGRSPIRYLTEWRMHLAEELLVTTDLTVAAVARRVGYDSEEAFSRAFKRARGQSPSHWRSARSAVSEAAGSTP